MSSAPGSVMSLPVSHPSSLQDDSSHKQLSSLAESIRALRETGSARSAPAPNVLPSRQEHRAGLHRKHTPSPLQSSQVSTPNAHRGQSALSDHPKPYSPPSSHSSPSPSDLEHARPAPDRYQAAAAGQGRGQPSPEVAKPAPTDSGPGDPRLSKPSSYGQLRNVSAPVFTSAGLSPPSSPNAMSSSKPGRPGPRPAMIRTSSIDSAASSVSSASQSHRSNVSLNFRSPADASSSSPPDLASLTAAAGSAETALLNLWKEKQGALAHNTKLWRLVEKQRTMILGLNRDLERALKDKERYRKKLKENLAHIPPLPGATQRVESELDRDRSQSPAFIERAPEHSGTTETTRRAAIEPSHDSTPKAGRGETSPAEEEPSPELGVVPRPLMISHVAKDLATTTAPDARSKDELDSPGPPKEPAVTAKCAKRFDNSAEAVDPTALEVKSAEPSSINAVRQGRSVGDKADCEPTNALAEIPSLALIGPTPVMEAAEFGDSVEGRVPQPLRKGPPTPLDLSKSSRISDPLHHGGSIVDQDSDSDDILEIDEIPIIDRGRRRTREEDDRLREVLALREQEHESRFKKSKSKSKSKGKSKSKSKQPSGNDISDRDVSVAPGDYHAPPSNPPAASNQPPTTRAQTDQETYGSLGARLEASPPALFNPRPASSVPAPLMSPGLPLSPRPGDRPPHAPQPRMIRQHVGELPTSPRDQVGPNPLSPRAPKQPLPLPPNSPLALISPHLARLETYQQLSQPQAATPAASLLMPPSSQIPHEVEQSGAGSESSAHEVIYRGLISDQYPTLLLPPNALPLIDVKVFSSRLRPSRNSIMMPKPTEEDPVFILAIFARSDGRQLWRVEKTIVALPMLDQQIRTLTSFNGKLPDRSLFSGHAPAKIDARRAALNGYFETLLDTPMDEKAAVIVCDFFSTDVIGIQADEAQQSVESSAAVPALAAVKIKMRKEGYLTKRGKNFGGWKARYFVLEGPEFRYYETAGGPHLGTIKLQNAQIGKQSQQQSNPSPPSRGEDADNQYRHAFLVLEPKKKDSSSLVRHVLCAESDEERDAWVDALLQYVDNRGDDESGKLKEQEKEAGPARAGVLTKAAPEDRSESERQDSLQGVSYEDTIAAEAPVRGPSGTRAEEGHSPPLNDSMSGAHSGTPVQHPAISGPTNGTVIQNAENWGNRSLAAPPHVKEKKRSIFGFRGRASADLQAGLHVGTGALSSQQNALDRHVQGRPIFGMPLVEAVEVSAPEIADTCLPAVVYRCLEYLRDKKAASEEGIFRLSGSNLVIKALRDRFNNEGDVRLLDGQYYDVHAVASLLKLYLRELPVSILTRELHLDFLRVLGKTSPSMTEQRDSTRTDLDEKHDKLEAFNVLVHKLPKVNYELIRALSLFLIDIINRSDVNKMTVRNGKETPCTHQVPRRVRAMLILPCSSRHCLCSHTKHSGTADIFVPHRLCRHLRQGS